MRSLPLLAALIALSGCTPARESTESTAAVGEERSRSPMIVLTGAGATFPYPLYSTWFSLYAESFPVRVNYQSIGSGGGIRQLTAGTVDFGASDVPMSEEALARADFPLNLPTVLGSVAIVYNLADLRGELRLDGATLAEIFLGRIDRWSDPRIRALNPGIALPDRDLLVVHRSDGSGTTELFTGYLAGASPLWASEVGAGQAVRWPTGLGAKGNEGVAGQVEQLPGSIGYLEYSFAEQLGMRSAALRNSSGHFIAPSTAASTAAVRGVGERLEEANGFRISLLDSPAPDAYPIASWTYLLVPRHFESCARGRALLEVMRWAFREGDPVAERLHYARLPEEVKSRVLREWQDTVRCGPSAQPLEEG